MSQPNGLHVIWLEVPFEPHPSRYATIGPFLSLEAANEWFEGNRFEQQQEPIGHWLKVTKSTFRTQGGTILEVQRLHAFVELLQAPEKVFIHGQ